MEASGGARCSPWLVGWVRGRILLSGNDEELRRSETILHIKILEFKAALRLKVAKRQVHLHFSCVHETDATTATAAHQFLYRSECWKSVYPGQFK